MNFNNTDDAREALSTIIETQGFSFVLSELRNAISYHLTYKGNDELLRFARERLDNILENI